jgi:hypothetical protein
MSTQKIVLINESRLLRSILKRAIEKDNDLQVVAEVDDYKKIPPVIDNVDPNWIVLTLPPKESIPNVINTMLRDKPDLRCLVMAPDGSRVRMKWIETHDISLSEKNLEELLTILRESGVKDELRSRMVT